MEPGNKPAANANNENGETIKELADKHLHDKNHHTTDEEILNAQVEFTELEDSEMADDIKDETDDDK